jgi:hypothetical protein
MTCSTYTFLTKSIKCPPSLSISIAYALSYQKVQDLLPLNLVSTHRSRYINISTELLKIWQLHTSKICSFATKYIDTPVVLRAKLTQFLLFSAVTTTPGGTRQYGESSAVQVVSTVGAARVMITGE